MSGLLSAAAEPASEIAGTFLLVFGCVIWAAGLMVLGLEQERLPLRWLRWTPYITDGDGYQGRDVVVGVRRKGQRVPLTSVCMRDEGYGESLAAAVSEARARCIALNSESKALRRRLP